MKFKVKKGDHVIVISGADKGKKGTVLKVFTKESRVLVSGVRVVKCHLKPSKVSDGGITYKESPIHISNVAHVDPVSGVAVKVGFRIGGDGKKIRFSRKSGEIISGVVK